MRACARVRSARARIHTHRFSYLNTVVCKLSEWWDPESIGTCQQKEAGEMSRKHRRIDLHVSHTCRNVSLWKGLRTRMGVEGTLSLYFGFPLRFQDSIFVEDPVPPDSKLASVWDSHSLL